jgi:protein gp37
MTMSSIEWTERTWNPVIGCKKVSQGCKNCYAETMSRRLKAMGANGYDKSFSEVVEMRERLHQPLKVRASATWFVNSMSDLFQEEVSDSFVEEVFCVMERAHWHRFQILTKRPERMREYFARRSNPPQNVWLGTSVENRRQGVPRIDILREVPAHIRFLSIEPLLEDLGVLDLHGIDWVIVGGESGPRARPMKLDWVTAIHEQCRHQGVPFFFKQWGAFGADGKRRSKKANGRIFEGETWNEMPEFERAVCSAYTPRKGALMGA